MGVEVDKSCKDTSVNCDNVNLGYSKKKIEKNVRLLFLSIITSTTHFSCKTRSLVIQIQLYSSSESDDNNKKLFI